MPSYVETADGVKLRRNRDKNVFTVHNGRVVQLLIQWQQDHTETARTRISGTLIEVPTRSCYYHREQAEAWLRRLQRNCDAC